MTEIKLEMTVQEALALMRPGDQLLTSDAGTFLAEAILWWQSLWLDRPTRFSHAMRFYGNGMVASQDLTYATKPLSKWVGSWMRIWRNESYSDDQQRAVVTTMARDLDRPWYARLYDVPGIGGQIVKPLPFIGKEASEAIEIPWLNFCSEGEIQREREANPDYMAEMSQGSPEDMNAYNKTAPGWREVSTFKLVA